VTDATGRSLHLHRGFIASGQFRDHFAGGADQFAERKPFIRQVMRCGFVSAMTTVGKFMACYD